MDIPNKDEVIAKARLAENALEELGPYFRAVEALYTEQLIGITGWKAWWRGDRRRAEAAARIRAVRDVKDAVYRVIQQGRIAATPPRRMGI